MSGSIVVFPGSSVVRRPARPTTSQRLRALVTFVVQEWRLRRDLAQLQALDPRSLQDMGLDRGGLEGAIRHGSRARVPADANQGAVGGTSDTLPLPSSWTEWR